MITNVFPPFNIQCLEICSCIKIVILLQTCVSVTVCQAVRKAISQRCEDPLCPLEAQGPVSWEIQWADVERVMPDNESL